jgi:site-specific DNA-cytosine methylase
MNVLVACEYSGVVRDAFRNLGHNAWSCDILECEADPRFHIQRDVLQILDQDWDLMIAHPPCTYLCRAGTSWNKRRPERHALQDEAAEFFMALYNCNIPKIAVENPAGVMSTRFRPPDQYVEPYYFGDPYPKKTGLWLKNLPKLVPTNVVEPSVVHYNGKRYSVIHDGPPGTNRKDRAKARSKTFQGLADAMASQWGKE